MIGDSETLNHHEPSEKKIDGTFPLADSDDVVYPPMREVIPIMLALCLTMFLYQYPNSGFQSVI